MPHGPTDPASMSTDAVDDVFESLAGAVREFASAHPLDVAEIPDASDDVDEDSFEPRRHPRAPSWPDPQRALRLARSRLASDVRRRRAATAREFAAWWADLASVAVDATATGRPVQVVRAAVGDPSLYMTDEDLQHLPGTSFHGEGLVIVDHPAPDQRRDQVWGADWTDHQVPPLPSVAKLSDQLTECGVPAHQIADVCGVREAIAGALDASGNLREEPDSEALLERAEQLTDLLMEYARLLTDSLRQVWSVGR